MGHFPLRQFGEAVTMAFSICSKSLRSLCSSTSVMDPGSENIRLPRMEEIRSGVYGDPLVDVYISMDKSTIFEM